MGTRQYIADGRGWRRRRGSWRCVFGNCGRGLGGGVILLLRMAFVFGLIGGSVEVGFLRIYFTVLICSRFQG